MLETLDPAWDWELVLSLLKELLANRRPLACLLKTCRTHWRLSCLRGLTELGFEFESGCKLMS